MLEKGKIYRVTNYAYENTLAVRVMANRDGWLWVAEENQTDFDRLYQFRSVATGDTDSFLFRELEEADA
jgi:hypothetical protein